MKAIPPCTFWNTFISSKKNTKTETSERLATSVQEGKIFSTREQVASPKKCPACTKSESFIFVFFHKLFIFEAMILGGQKSQLQMKFLLINPFCFLVQQIHKTLVSVKQSKSQNWLILLQRRSKNLPMVPEKLC